MKKIISMLALLIAGSLQQSFAQNTNEQLLNTYYTLKEALVNGKPELAATQAAALATAARDLKDKGMRETDRAALIKDAGLIAATQDLKQQRTYFATLSGDMIHLAKDIKLSEQPLYLMYCPMKKASWLSAENKVRNPYFGNSMLTCGSVTETIK